MATMLMRGWLVIVALLAFESAASACTCVLDPSPCSQQWRLGQVVFVGTVKAKTQVQKPLNIDKHTFMVSRFVYRFTVSEGFRGGATAGQEIEIETGSGGGDCGYPFEIEKSYLVYAGPGESQLLSTGICSPTRLAIMVAGLTRQLRALREGRAVDALFGTIGVGPRGAGYSDLVESKPLADVHVRAIGSDKVEYSAKTDREGVYSFATLPAGEYTLDVDLPKGYSTWQRNLGELRKLKISDSSGAGGCAADLFARPDGRISGMVVDNDGKGVAGFISMESVDAKQAETDRVRGGLSASEIQDGSFKLWLIPPGKYRLLFYPKIGGQVNFRHPPTKSDVIEVGLGEQIEGVRIKFDPTHKP